MRRQLLAGKRPSWGCTPKLMKNRSQFLQRRRNELFKKAIDRGELRRQRLALKGFLSLP
ncbi:hypothetical protein [Novosphingobium taihuense]|uniref:hypothetical protein n=1 Tax=Novosphingobium taihuense TaxID=260085 RepID=UPI00161130AA|nr:hypothetical protein [Novosphingobium taihuense]